MLKKEWKYSVTDKKHCVSNKGSSAEADLGSEIGDHVHVVLTEHFTAWSLGGVRSDPLFGILLYFYQNLNKDTSRLVTFHTKLWRNNWRFLPPLIQM